MATAVALTLTLGVVPVKADTTPLTTTGSGVPNDWSQEWLESGVGTFNTIYVFSISGDGLATPGLADLGNGWTEINLGPTGYAAELTGADATQEYFNTYFADPGTHDVFDFFALENGVVVDSARINNFGAGSDMGYGLSLESTTPNFESDHAAITPEPSTLFLLGTGLLCLAGMVFKKAKGNSQIALSSPSAA